MSETDAQYLRRIGREGWKPRGLVPPGRAFSNIASRMERNARRLDDIRYGVTQFTRAAKLTKAQRNRLIEIIGGEWP